MRIVLLSLLLASCSILKMQTESATIGVVCLSPYGTANQFRLLAIRRPDGSLLHRYPSSQLGTYSEFKANVGEEAIVDFALANESLRSSPRTLIGGQGQLIVIGTPPVILHRGFNAKKNRKRITIPFDRCNSINDGDSWIELKLANGSQKPDIRSVMRSKCAAEFTGLSPGIYYADLFIGFKRVAIDHVEVGLLEVDSTSQLFERN